MDPHPDTPSAPLSPTARKLRTGFFAALALLAALNLVIHPHEPHFGLDAYPGFWALFGLVGAVVLGRAAKGLAHTVLGRDENYYEKGSAVQGFNGSTVEKTKAHGDAPHAAVARGNPEP